MLKLLDKFEKKCIKLGELQTAHQAIRFEVRLGNGNTLQGEINNTIKEIEDLKRKLNEGGDNA
jgi:hypothetical protein